MKRQGIWESICLRRQRKETPIIHPFLRFHSMPRIEVSGFIVEVWKWWFVMLAGPSSSSVGKLEAP